MQYVAYTLSMPSVNTWNGKWSGEEKMYCRVRSYRDKSSTDVDGITSKVYFRYNFGDGWVAQVTASRIPDKKAVRDLEKRSAGFCGYDWMIDSIERHGEIRV